MERPRALKSSDRGCQRAGDRAVVSTLEGGVGAVGAFVKGSNEVYSFTRQEPPISVNVYKGPRNNLPVYNEWKVSIKHKGMQLR